MSMMIRVTDLCVNVRLLLCCSRETINTGIKVVLPKICDKTMNMVTSGKSKEKMATGRACSHRLLRPYSASASLLFIFLFGFFVRPFFFQALGRLFLAVFLFDTLVF